jgi:hypothetical protein
VGEWGSRWVGGKVGREVGTGGREEGRRKEINHRRGLSQRLFYLSCMGTGKKGKGGGKGRDV